MKEKVDTIYNNDFAVLLVRIILLSTFYLLFTSCGFAQQFIDQSIDLGVTQTSGYVQYGSGISTVDYNDDGLDDITLANNIGEILFYKNTGSGFELEQFGVLVAGNTKQILWIDYDNDEDKDIFLTTNQGQVLLYRNDGNFVFTEITEESGLPTYSGLFTGASFGDYNADGNLDLYLAKYVQEVENPTDYTFRNNLFRNEGNGTFTDVTISSGISMPPVQSFQPVWFDYNGDNLPELLVINDRNPSNFFFLNLGGQFMEAASFANLGYAGDDIMSNSVADFDHDGDLDIYMTNTGGVSSDTRSRLAVANDQLSFTESAEVYGCDALIFGWGALWIDADNDTWEDLAFVTPNEDPIYFFQNNSGESFTQQNNQISVAQWHTSYAPALADVNNDGFADIVVQCETPNHPYVLVNQGGENHHLKVTLNGTLSNKDAIGSWIAVYNEGEAQYKYTFSGQNYLGQNSQHHLFGLGNEPETIDSVIVTYQSGHKDKYYNLPVDSSYYFTEGETYEVEISAGENNYFCSGDSILLDAGNHDSYQWDNGSTEQLRWVYTSGFYSITTKNENQISANDSIFVEEIPLPILSFSNTPPSCAGDSTGIINVVNINEYEADSVLWNNGLYGQEIDQLPAGEYGCTYIDIHGCVGSGTTTLISPSELISYIKTTPEHGDNFDGSIKISIFGGTPDYQILLEGEEVNQLIENVQAGTYQISILDANGCNLDTSATVDQIMGILPQEDHLIAVFPVPASNTLHIKSNSKISSIKVIDAKGYEALKLINPQQTSVGIEHLASGIYLLQVTFQNGALSQSTFVKE